MKPAPLRRVPYVRSGSIARHRTYPQLFSLRIVRRQRWQTRYQFFFVRELDCFAQDRDDIAMFKHVQTRRYLNVRELGPTTTAVEMSRRERGVSSRFGGCSVGARRGVKRSRPPNPEGMVTRDDSHGEKPLKAKVPASCNAVAGHDAYAQNDRTRVRTNPGAVSLTLRTSRMPDGPSTWIVLTERSPAAACLEEGSSKV